MIYETDWYVLSFNVCVYDPHALKLTQKAEHKGQNELIGLRFQICGQLNPLPCDQL